MPEPLLRGQGLPALGGAHGAPETVARGQTAANRDAPGKSHRTGGHERSQKAEEEPTGHPQSKTVGNVFEDLKH